MKLRHILKPLVIFVGFIPLLSCALLVGCDDKREKQIRRAFYAGATVGANCALDSVTLAFEEQDGDRLMEVHDCIDAKWKE